MQVLPSAISTAIDDGGNHILGARALGELGEASVRHRAAAPETCAEGDREDQNR
jgi:hypothetical protein